MKDLDEFLKEDALKQQDENLNVTYLAICNNEIIGYVSLLADTISYKKVKSEVNIMYDEYPAVKIGRFAISEK